MNKKYMLWGWVFVMPYVIGFFIFYFYPFIYSIYLSFTRYDLFNPPRWIGLRNWITTLQNPILWVALRNNLYYGLIFVPLQTILGCIFAVALNQKLRAMPFYRLLYFFPVISPWVGIGLLWSWIYNPQFGLLNHILSLIGMGPFNFVASIRWYEAIGSIAIVSVWKGVGQVTVLLLAGLQGISSDVLEAADIDGTNTFQRFFKIILPLLTPMIFLVVVLGVISTFQVFEPFIIMLNSGTAGGSMVKNEFAVFNSLIYENGFIYGKLGIASTISWIAFAFVGSITYIQRMLEKRWVHYE